MNNIDAENAILGAAMTFADSLPHMTTLTTADFSREENKRIWAAVVKLMQTGQTPDAVLVHEIDNTISMADLAQLMDFACATGSVEHYIDILHNKERQRRVYHAARMAQSGIDDGAEIEQVETDLLKAIAERTASDTTACLDGEVTTEGLLNGEDVQPWVSFGIDEIDAATGGIRPGEVCIIAARTSVGKSAAAVLSTLRSAEMGWTPLYMSFEMSRRQLWYRFMSYQSTVSLRKFRDARFDEYDAGRIRKAERELKPVLRCVRVNLDANTPGALTSLIRMEQLQGGAEYVIIDHAGRMHSDSRSRSDYERMSSVANCLKDIAIKLNIPMLVLWQLNRGVERSDDKKPTLADLRDSGQAEEIADTVILLSRSNYYDKSVPIGQVMVTADIAKARDGGQLGEVQFPWLSLISRPHLVAVEDLGVEVDEIEF